MSFANLFMAMHEIGGTLFVEKKFRSSGKGWSACEEKQFPTEGDAKIAFIEDFEQDCFDKNDISHG